MAHAPLMTPIPFRGLLTVIYARGRYSPANAALRGGVTGVAFAPSIEVMG